MKKSSNLKLVIWGGRQSLDLISRADCLSSFPVSTSARGFGNRENSGKTPVGHHIIGAKIGENMPLGTVFKGRVPTGEIITRADCSKDFITTRILWLEGTEPEINQGPGVDTRHRMIYIHGTPAVSKIGTPCSHGCIRMRGEDIILLFNHVTIGTAVEIIP